MVVEDEFDRDLFEQLALEVECDRIDKFEMIYFGQRPPGIFFGSEVQVHDGAMLRKIQAALAPAHLLELLLGQFALLEQDIANLSLERADSRVHWIGTSTSRLMFNGRTLVCAAG